MMFPGTNLSMRSEDEREAPSAVINALKSIARWHLLIAFALLTLAATVPWYLAGQFATRRAIMILNGLPEPAPDHTLAAAFGGTCLAGALFMFRSWYGLYTFDRIRRANRVKATLRYLWWAWFVMALLLLAGAVWFTYFWVHSPYFAGNAGH